MSIASQITTMQEHIEDIYDTFAVAGVDTSAAAKNIVNINANLKERLEYYLANGLDVVWDNWNKVSGSGTTLSLNNTIQAKMDFVYKGNTSQSILPSGYTQVDYITSDGNSYIDTGKTLGDNFKIETKFIHNQQSSNEQPIISTWVQSFQWFNLYIASNNQLRFYATGNNMTSNPTLTIGNINTVSYSRNSNEWVGTLNGETVTFNTNISADNPTTFKILSRGDVTLGSYVSIYRLKLFENNILTMDLIPCYRNNDNVIGMYDIVNNIFYTNSGTGNFTYGSVAPNPECPIPVNVVTGDNEVKAEGKNLINVSLLDNKTVASVTYTPQNDQSLLINGTKYGQNNVNFNGYKLHLQVGTYTLTPFIISGSVSEEKSNVIKIINSNNEEINIENYFLSNPRSSQFVITKEDDYYIRFSFGDGFIINNVYLKLQIEKGSTASEYQPYESATYPINLGSMELCKIGDYQDYIAKSTGKNLFSGWAKGKSLNPTNGAERNDESGVYGAVSDYIPVNFATHTNYYLSGLSDTISSFIGAYNSSKQFLGRTAGSNRKNIGLTSSSFTSGTPQGTGDIAYLRITQYTSTSASDVNVVDTLQTQLEIGNDGSSYEPYGKVWYKYGAIGKVVLDGSENWTYYQHYLQMSLTGGIDWVGSVAPQGLCNKYICRARYFIINTTYKKDKSISLGSSFLALYDSNFTDVTSFKTWLSTYNTTVYYALLTPTITPITDTTLLNQLEAIKLSYNEQTNISQTNTDKPFILDVTALKDLDVEDTTPTLTTNQGLLFTQPPVSENSINDEDDNSILEETINEEEPNIEDDNREEEEPGDFFEKEIINNDEEQEEIPPEPIEIDNGQR